MCQVVLCLCSVWEWSWLTDPTRQNFDPDILRQAPPPPPRKSPSTKERWWEVVQLSWKSHYFELRRTCISYNQFLLNWVRILDCLQDEFKFYYFVKYSHFEMLKVLHFSSCTIMFMEYANTVHVHCTVGHIFHCNTCTCSPSYSWL